MFWTPHPITPRTWNARFASAAPNRSLISLAELSLCSPAELGPPERKPRDAAHRAERAQSRREAGASQRVFRSPGVGAVMFALLPTAGTRPPGTRPAAAHAQTPQNPRFNASGCTVLMKSPYLGDPRKIYFLTYVRGAPFRRHFACSYPKRAQMATRLIAPELISEPPELIPSASAAQGENLSIKVPRLQDTCHQSPTACRKPSESAHFGGPHRSTPYRCARRVPIPK